jgi:hypothetical protein
MVSGITHAYVACHTLYTPNLPAEDGLGGSQEDTQRGVSGYVDIRLRPTNAVEGATGQGRGHR